jgi:hypothetical protein
MSDSSRCSTSDKLFVASSTPGVTFYFFRRYTHVIHFDKGQTPPANAFWSITMYNAKQAFVANPINRYAIGDRDKLKFNADGSLDIYIQHDSPGKEKESN